MLLPIEIAIDESLANVEKWLARVDRLGLDQFVTHSANRHPNLASPLLAQAVVDAAGHSAELYNQLSRAVKSLQSVNATVDYLWSLSANLHTHFLRARNEAIEAELFLSNAATELHKLKAGA
jgi:hypothetical protein